MTFTKTLAAIATLLFPANSLAALDAWEEEIKEPTVAVVDKLVQDVYHSIESGDSLYETLTEQLQQSGGIEPAHVSEIEETDIQLFESQKHLKNKAVVKRVILRDEAGREHRPELYIDDMLMQTYVYEPGSSKVGLIANKADVVFTDMQGWSMSLL